MKVADIIQRFKWSISSFIFNADATLTIYYTLELKRTGGCNSILERRFIMSEDITLNRHRRLSTNVNVKLMNCLPRSITSYATSTTAG